MNDAPDTSRTRPGTLRLRRLLGLLLGCSAALPIHARPPAPEPPIEVFLDEDRPDVERRNALDHLLTADPDPTLIEPLAALLTAPEASETTRTILLDAIARDPSPPGALLAHIIALVNTGHAEIRTSALRALAGYRTREAIETLLSAIPDLDEGPPRAAAWASLIHITGRDDLPRDPGAWREWFSTIEYLPAPAFQARLADGLAARTRRLEERLQTRIEELVRLHREEYLGDAGAEWRSRKLAEMLTHDEPAIRSLAFDLAARELASASVSLGAEVSAAAAALLAHDDVLVRRSAAALLSRMDAAGVASMLVAALSTESDPAVAASLLDSASRSPVPGLRAPALAWLERGTTPDSAARAILALLEADLLEEPDLRDRVRAILRRRGVDTLGPHALRVLLALGTSEDRRAVLRLLDSPDPPRRQAVAAVLVPHPWATRSLVAAALKQPDLLQTAAEALARHGAASSPVLALARAPWPDPRVMQSALSRLAETLPAPAVVLIASHRDLDEPTRAALLAAFPRHAAEAQAQPDAILPIALATGLVMLAEARLSQPDPQGALEALELLPTSEPIAGDPRVRRLRTLARIATGETDLPREPDTPAGWWLDAAELALDRPFAHAVIDEIRRRFDGRLTDEERARLEDIAARIPHAAADAAGADPDAVENENPGPPG